MVSSSHIANTFRFIWITVVSCMCLAKRNVEVYEYFSSPCGEHHLWLNTYFITKLFSFSVLSHLPFKEKVPVLRGDTVLNYISTTKGHWAVGKVEQLCSHSFLVKLFPANHPASS